MTKKARILLAAIFLSFLTTSQLTGQCMGTATATGSGNWNAGPGGSKATWSFSGGATSPNDACLIVIPAGITVTINNNQTFIGSVEVSGTLDLGNQLNLGTTPGCGLTLKIFGAGLLAGNASADRLIICGTTVVTGQPVTPPGAVDWPADGSFSAGDLGGSGGGFGEGGSFSNSSYTWNGSASANWQTSTNWTPTRNTPAASDALTFDASGANKNITNVPTQTVGRIIVTGSATYSFVSTGSQSLTLSTTASNAFQIDAGSTLSNGAAGNPLNFTMPAGGTASIGGQLTLVNGNFGAGGATLILHTSATPLARTAGQVSLNGSSVLQFGAPSLTSGATIVLPNSIFVSSPTILSLIVNRTNGATLGDQSITITSAATFTLGDLNTNAAGRIRFSSTATNPTESTGSKIIGYAEMNSRTVGTGALTFLGYSMAAGADDVGTMSLTRRTGPTGINTFNSNQSIASTWEIIAAAEPTAGRNISFTWQSAFDNVTTTTNRFQSYIFDSGPGWTPLGALQLLAAVGPPRQTVAVSSVKLTDTFTVTDESQPLPVTLISFGGGFTDEGVSLDWITASQENFDRFEVERASDGINFRSIGIVPGDAFSVERIAYNFVDTEVKAGKYYYRLKNVDRDNSFDYSEIIAVSRDLPFAIILSPNPVRSTEVLLVQITSEPQSSTSFQLIDPHGRLVQEWESAAPVFSMPIENLSAGIYLIRAFNGSAIVAGKFILLE